MRKYSLFAILLIILIGLGWWGFSALNRTENEQFAQITLLNPTGPTVISAAALAAQKVETQPAVKVEYWKSTDEVIAALSADKSNFVVLPVTVAANIHAQGIELVLLGVHEWKAFYMVADSDNEYQGIDSLLNKKIYTPNGRGTTVDILLRAALADKAFDPELDADIVYAPPQEIVALFKTGKIEYAALPEPFVTMAIAEGHGQIVLDFQEYWAELSKSPARIPIAGLFVTRDFFQAHPDVAAQIAARFADSTTWGNNNLEQVAELTADILPLSPLILEESMRRTEFYYVPAKDCHAEVEIYLEKMQELYEQGLSQLPGKEFYQL